MMNSNISAYVHSDSWHRPLTQFTPVGPSFALSHNQLHTSHLHVAALLKRGVRVLVYVGAHDWVCNWIALEYLSYEDIIMGLLKTPTIVLSKSNELMGNVTSTEEKIMKIPAKKCKALLFFFQK